MKDILLRPELILSIRNGTKTVTRRVIKPQPEWKERRQNSLSGAGWFWSNNKTTLSSWSDDRKFTSKLLECAKPRFQVGEVVYIKEVHFRYGYWTTKGYTKKLDQKWIFKSITDEVRYLENQPPLVIGSRVFGKTAWYRRSPLFMPTWAARYFIRILNVRPERLQDIENEPDGYLKEGYKPLITGKSAINGKPFEVSMDFAWYEMLWNETNPKYLYASNLWIWRYEFELKK